MFLELVLTEKCNLACKYCFEHASKISENDMSLKILHESILMGIRQCNIQHDNSLSISFFGGEPLLRFDLIQEAISYTLQHLPEHIHSFFSISTNATLLSEEIVSFLIKHNCRIQFSIDGTPESHDKNRITHNGTGSWVILDRNWSLIMQCINESSIPVKVKMVVDPSNVPYLYDSVRFWAIPNIEFSFDINYNTQWSQYAFNCLYSEINQITAAYKNLRISGFFITEIERVLLGLNNHNFTPSFCGAGISRLTILPNGDIFPCARFIGEDSFRIGHLQNGFDSEKLFIFKEPISAHSCYKNCIMFRFRFLYKGIIIKHNKTEPTYTKTSLFLCEKRRFFMARTEKGVVTTI